MTDKIRAYRNWEEQYNDETSEWFWTEIVGKAVAVGLAISIPMFGFGAVTAPEGVNRWENGVSTTVAGHSFLWENAGNAAVHVAGAIDNAMDNGSSETN